MSTQDTRRDFEPWKVELVYRKQDGICIKCGTPLSHGFQRHHKNGDHSDNSVENLELHCPRCHQSEAFATYIKQKEKALGELEAAIKLGTEGKLAGAAGQVLLDAIKLTLGISDELYGYQVERVPSGIKTQAYLESSGLLLKAKEEGIGIGLMQGIELVNQLSITKKKEAK